jgi:Family of unknown function (DUF6448)
MPPHCDAMDGPVVKAAIRALEEDNVDLILPYVHEAAEEEVRRAFEKVAAARAVPRAREIGDLWFCETVVRLHRAGEGAPYTGLKPAGLDVGPVIPAAERAIDTGSPDALQTVLEDALHAEVKERLDRVARLRTHQETVAPAREYVQAMLGLQVWAHKLFGAMRGHEDGHAEEETLEDPGREGP